MNKEQFLEKMSQFWDKYGEPEIWVVETQVDDFWVNVSFPLPEEIKVEDL